MFFFFSCVRVCVVVLLYCSRLDCTIPSSDPRCCTLVILARICSLVFGYLLCPCSICSHHSSHRQRSSARRRRRHSRRRRRRQLSDEGEEQKCGAHATRKGERRIRGAGQPAAAAEGHHRAAGQGQHHSADDVVPEDARPVPQRYVRMMICHPRAFVIQSVQNCCGTKYLRSITVVTLAPSRHIKSHRQWAGKIKPHHHLSGVCVFAHTRVQGKTSAFMHQPPPPLLENSVARLCVSDRRQPIVINAPAVSGACAVVEIIVHTRTRSGGPAGVGFRGGCDATNCADRDK